jgi:hypothetical protein
MSIGAQSAERVQNKMREQSRASLHPYVPPISMISRPCTCLGGDGLTQWDWGGGGQEGGRDQMIKNEMHTGSQFHERLFEKKNAFEKHLDPLSLFSDANSKSLGAKMRS